MLENERLLKAIEELKRRGFAKNNNEICKKIGRSSSFLTDIRKEKQRISGEILMSLKKNYPINEEYILSGEGEILLKTSSNEEKIKQLKEEIERYHKIIDQLNYTIELQKEKIDEIKNKKTK
ncbi:MAG: hypothetical protein GX612_06165 [Bacteroidales bacterium]|jgi:transcriptional regulator with XRE-family HTH domain|nr:hypothetical protein [Bacteroidales bacterium]OQA92025.1 MAG: hypothetical protein BWY27_00414 [Bacteroidetes bacterium ADurb.Bin234]